MEALLQSCDAADLAPALHELGVSNIEEISVCEVEDLISDLNLTKDKAELIITKAKDAHLFDKRKTAITSTWKAVGESLGVEATKLFYKRLFEQYPSVVPLFAKADMDAQAEKLLKTIGLAVDYLDKVDELVPVLEEMGERHADAYKAERGHYDAVGESLLWTLKTGLGDAWTDDVADAWTWVYGLIATTMADAGDKAIFAKRKGHIERTWKAVGDSLGVEATKLFYKRLFQEYPAVVPMFSHADMDSQAEKLLKTVSMAVEYLGDMDTLVPVLQDLGRRHTSEWNVERGMYDAVGECLLWTLKTGLGDVWTDDVADAWTWVYGVISTTMADAGDAVVNEEKKSD